MPQGEEVKRCKHWKQGCSRPSCKFRHPKGEGYYKPLKQCWFERYSQCTRRRCKFEHVKNKNGGARVKRLEEQVKVAQKLANELFKEVQKLQAAKAKEEVGREDIESQERKCGAETRCKVEISKAEEVYDLLENTHGEEVQANARKLEIMREFGYLLQPRKLKSADAANSFQNVSSEWKQERKRTWNMCYYVAERLAWWKQGGSST